MVWNVAIGQNKEPQTGFTFLQSPRQRALLIFKMASVLALTSLSMPIGVRTCTYFATHANWCPSREHTIFCAENSKLSTHGSRCIPNIIGPNCSSARYWHAAYWSGGVTARVDSWRGSMYTVPFYACWEKPKSLRPKVYLYMYSASSQLRTTHSLTKHANFGLFRTRTMSI